MPAVTCRNCGELNVFVSGPVPAKVKCTSCGNTFRTEGMADPQADELIAQFQAVNQANSEGGFCAVAIGMLLLIGIGVAVYYFVFSG